MKQLIAVLGIVALVNVCGCQKQLAKAKHEDARWCDPEHERSKGTPDAWYTCVSDEAGPAGKKGRWTEDTAAENATADHEAYIHGLGIALETRVLTADEMKDALQYGYEMYTYPNWSYSEKELRQRFDYALKIQATLREFDQAPTPHVKAQDTPGGFSITAECPRGWRSHNTIEQQIAYNKDRSFAAAINLASDATCVRDEPKGAAGGK